MKPIFFRNAGEFRIWLEKNHNKSTEVLAGYYKVQTGKPSMTWSESVDQALCFGWIDGVRRSVDENSYTIRFTPRKPSSSWSEVNIKKVKALTKQGLMRKAGLTAFKKMKSNNSGIYAYENKHAVFPPEIEKEIRADKKAWKYFQSLAPSYKNNSIRWVMSAKQEATRIKRLNILIADSGNGTNQWKDNKYAGKRTKLK